MFRRKLSFIIYLPFIIGLLLFYINYLEVRYGDTPISTSDIKDPFVSEYGLCNRACSNIAKIHCKEMVSPLGKADICSYTCDAHLAEDDLLMSPEWRSIFSCASLAKDSKDLKNCNITCTVMEEL